VRDEITIASYNTNVTFTITVSEFILFLELELIKKVACQIELWSDKIVKR